MQILTTERKYFLGGIKMLVTKILNMKNQEIIAMLNLEERELAKEKFANLNNFCDAYQDAAELSHQEEFFTPSGYLFQKNKLFIYSKLMSDYLTK